MNIADFEMHGKDYQMRLAILDKLKVYMDTKPFPSLEVSKPREGTLQVEFCGLTYRLTIEPVIKADSRSIDWILQKYAVENSGQEKLIALESFPMRQNSIMVKSPYEGDRPEPVDFRYDGAGEAAFLSLFEFWSR